MQETLGTSWTHSYTRHVEVSTDQLTATLFTDEGNVFPFTRTSTSADFLPPAGLDMYLKIALNDDDIHLIYRNRDWDLFSLAHEGKLERFGDATVAEAVVGYNENDRVGTITDASGNILKLTYNEDGFLRSVTAPSVGNPLQTGGQAARVFLLEIIPEAELLRVSTARPGPDFENNPDDRLVWAEFQSVDGRIASVTDRVGTTHDLFYDGNGILTNATLDVGSMHLNLPRTFDFQWRQTDPNCTDCVADVVCTATVTGSRAPTPDATVFSFDTRGRLLTIKDPLQRIVQSVEWDTTNYRPVTVSNVLGGQTEFGYDSRGNVTDVTPSVGGAINLVYDAEDRLTGVTDQANKTTTLQYTDTDNPRRPTVINGPGNSDMSLSWGNDVDSNIGRLVGSNSPNGITQGFRYSNGAIGQGKGNLIESLHGRAAAGSGSTRLQDAVYSTDAVGTVYQSAQAGEPGNVHKCSTLPVYLPNGHIPEWDGESNVCTNEDQTCPASFDGDGNKTSVCSECTTPNDSDPAEYNGNGQPLHISSTAANDPATYDYAYDRLGRMTSEVVEASPFDPNGSPPDYPVFDSKVPVSVDHEVASVFNDATGIAMQTYSRANRPPQHPTSETPITTTTATDLAGRVTSVTTVHGSGGGATTESLTYTYHDSTTLPAVTETRDDGSSSEWYLDKDGRLTKIVHRNSLGAEILSLTYTRDAKSRITGISEVVNGTGPANVTTYTYGVGHLTSSDLDTGATVDVGRVYYNWFGSFSGALADGDPNRLVKEVRTGTNAYHHEYWYDAGGNRLAMRKSVNTGTPSEPIYAPVELTRYNYAYATDIPDDLTGFDPRAYTGEPNPGASQPAVRNTYSGTNSLGADELKSFTRYPIDPATKNRLDGESRYTSYAYNGHNGAMSRKMSWDGGTRRLTDQTYSHQRRMLMQAVTTHSDWPTTSGDPSTNHHGFSERYAYDVFGRRVGVMHCPKPTTPVGRGACRIDSLGLSARTFDYVNGRVFCERETDLFIGPGATPPFERLISAYTYGAMGLAARRGVSERNGNWQSEANGGAGGFVSGPTPPHKMCSIRILGDAMGNTVGTATASGYLDFQTFDAFGNLIGSWAAINHGQCAADLFEEGLEAQSQTFGEGTQTLQGDYDYADVIAGTNDPPNLVDRLAAGRQQWRGSEGSQTDIASADATDGQGAYLYAAGTRPSTGLIYMQARYYDPQVGRFTQTDPMPYGMEMAWGQNNRWTYCANDPVNCSDPSGNIWFLALIGFVAGFGFGMALGAIMDASTSLWGLLRKLLSAIVSGVCFYQALTNFTDALNAAMAALGQWAEISELLSQVLGVLNGLGPVAGAIAVGSFLVGALAGVTTYRGIRSITPP